MPAVPFGNQTSLHTIHETFIRSSTQPVFWDHCLSAFLGVPRVAPSSSSHPYCISYHTLTKQPQRHGQFIAPQLPAVVGCICISCACSSGNKCPLSWAAFSQVLKQSLRTLARDVFACLTSSLQPSVNISVSVYAAS